MTGGVVLDQVVNPQWVEWFYREEKKLLTDRWGLRPQTAGLAGGLMGVALYLTARMKGEPDPVRRELIEARLGETLNEVVERIETVGWAPWLFSGSAGVGWGFDRLAEVGILETGGEDPNEVIDEEVLKAFQLASQSGTYMETELITGCAGLGLYGLGRPVGTRGGDIVSASIAQIARAVVWDGDLCFWPSMSYYLSKKAGVAPTPDLVRSHGELNLGASHGIPGTVAFLGMAAAAGYDEALPLWRGGWRWLRSVTQERTDGFALISALQRDGTPIHENPSRITWCYGELGASVAILNAARKMRDAEAAAWAEAVALLAANRIDPESSIRDASLCHGSLGNAWLFNRVCGVSAHQRFRDVRDFWFEDGMRRCRDENGFPVFKSVDENDQLRENPYLDEPFTLLDGGLGPMFVLAERVAPSGFAWDGFLLSDLA